MESIFFPSPPSSTPPPPPSPIRKSDFPSSLLRSSKATILFRGSRFERRSSQVSIWLESREKLRAENERVVNARQLSFSCERDGNVVFDDRRNRWPPECSEWWRAIVPSGMPVYCHTNMWNVAYPRERMADNEWRVCPAIIRITLEPFNRRDNTPFVGG